MKILFATDGSPAALAALETLVDRLAWFQGPVALTLLTVHAPIPYKGAAAWAGKDVVASYYDEGNREALAPAIAALAGRGRAHDTLMRVGEAATEIATCAKAGGFDLIAMGSQGHTALATLMLGSVTSKVLAHSRVPVLVLR